jgi:hypothetical protein
MILTARTAVPTLTRGRATRPRRPHYEPSGSGDPAASTPSLPLTTARGVPSRSGRLDTIATLPHLPVRVDVSADPVPHTVDDSPHLPPACARTDGIVTVLGTHSPAHHAPPPPHAFAPTQTGMASLEGTPPDRGHEHRHRTGGQQVDPTGPAGEERRDIDETLSPLRGS